MNIKFYIVLIVCGLILTSCAPNSSILYLQDSERIATDLKSFANTIQPDDNLLITITSDDSELAAPFNNMFLAGESTQSKNISSDEKIIGYLVDTNGEIDFPRIGKIHVGGLTRIQAEEKLRGLITPYIINPGINLRILNFKISVIGEVQRPGSQEIDGDRITILEALSNAGDLTIYGKRSHILVIREKEGVRSIKEIDLTNSDFINSEYYYLAHNDVIYVSPNKTKVNSSIVGPNLTVGLSAISLIITIIALSIR